MLSELESSLALGVLLFRLLSGSTSELTLSPSGAESTLDESELEFGLLFELVSELESERVAELESELDSEWKSELELAKLGTVRL